MPLQETQTRALPAPIFQALWRRGQAEHLGPTQAALKSVCVQVSWGSGSHSGLDLAEVLPF